MSSEEVRKNTFEIYLKQYEQCWQDKRNLEAMIWQTPAVFLAVVGVLLVGLISIGFPTIPTSISGSEIAVRYALYAIVLYLGFSVLLVGDVQLRKHRVFCNARVDDMRRLENDLRRMGNGVWPIGFTTPEAIQWIQLYPDISRRWIDRQSAYEWLFGLISIVTILLLVSATACSALVVLAL